MAGGMRKNLANYGDADFSFFLRKAFIKALGYTDEGSNFVFESTFEDVVVAEELDPVERGKEIAPGTN